MSDGCSGDRVFWLHLDLKGAPPRVAYLTSLLTWLRDVRLVAEFVRVRSLDGARNVLVEHTH